MKVDCIKLNLALAKSCLSMTELSKLSGINKVTLTRIRKERQEPKPKTVGKIAKALNVDVTELIEE
jgi:transcriptional regulator with XRE-family HTH domain